MIDFIVVGAQKAGTSWMYACLYEHPQICAPTKEIHYFSRQRNFKKGLEWYENIFARCEEGKLKGEFSTTYLYDEKTPQRIKDISLDTKIIMSLRNPVTRAFSQYRNLIKGGDVDKAASFDEVSEKDASVLGQGMYFEQAKRYIDTFGKENVLVLVYEDSKKDPAGFIRQIFEFLEVDPDFKPTMLHRKVNTARTPKTIWIEKVMMHVAEILRRCGLGKIFWLIKKSSLPDKVRSMNTEQRDIVLDKETEIKLKQYFKEDVQKLATLTDKKMVSQWHIGETAK
ncbi:MAG: sulfotransferase domain-containing protein [Candidatus Pacebacteria bacterium]|nr:sulfotransferase domain-containing protein [Candidatus Paceibacterota bacterium]